MRYPYIPHLFCTKIQQGQPLIFYGKNLGGAAVTIPVPASAQYRYCRMTLLFTAPNYVVMNDADLVSNFNGVESNRYVEGPKRVNTLYALNRRGADFQWTETSTTGTSGPITAFGDSRSFLNFGIIQQLAKQQVVAKWRMIPEACLFPNGAFGPSPNIDYCYGSVNDQTWNQQATGTVFLDNWTPEVEESPYPLSLNTWLVPSRLWSVTLSFRIFDPETDPGNPTRGWNCQPWVDGKWYLASFRNNRGQGVLYQTDFNGIWEPN